MPAGTAAGVASGCTVMRAARPDPPPTKRTFPLGSADELLNWPLKEVPSGPAASNASKVLRNPKSTKAEKSAAGSALSQVGKHGKK